MNNPDVQMIIGRAFIDAEFRKQCYTDWDNVCDSFNISDDTERKQAAEFLKRIVSFYGSQKKDTPIQPQVTDAADQQDRNKIELNLMKQQVNIAMDVQRYAVEVLKTTVHSARISFSRISLMSYIIFGVGISLFTLSALFGLYFREESFTTIFGVLGVANFVSLFIFGPSKNVQKALSNLLQAEVIFMNFWDQVHFWGKYTVSDDLSVVKEASDNLHRITKECISMLEKYIEETKKEPGQV
jgi:uncharacterized membrane protein